jgi:hypothetical protein
MKNSDAAGKALEMFCKWAEELAKQFSAFAAAGLQPCNWREWLDKEIDRLSELQKLLQQRGE